MGLEALENVPFFLPGVAASMALALAIRDSVAARLGATRPVAALIVISLGVILSATLTPLEGALSGELTGVGTCDMSRLSLAPLSELVRISDTSLNIALFVPLGAAIGLLSRRTQGILIPAALLMPPAIEATQLLVTPLGRACQGADIVDNTTGLLLGLTLGWILCLRRHSWSNVG